MRFILALLVLLVPLSSGAQTQEQRVLAAVLAAEGADQGTEGMLAIAEVIRQRSVLLRCTPLSAATRRNKKTGFWAFSCLNGLGPTRLTARISRRPEFRDALVIARRLTDNPASLGNRTRGATFFTRKTEKPRWARGSNPVLVLGDHAFYRLPFP